MICKKLKSHGLSQILFASTLLSCVLLFVALDRVPAAARPAANSGARPQEQQTEEGVIRFIREPDAAPEFAVKGHGWKNGKPGGRRAEKSCC